ncbi:MAG: hypothetical protein J6V24_12520 [Clostridia bacterium]|nr:hypothetical protein [Clostridia bacterium]MBO7405779.1 hypothetical protein [Clostridia bacterium]
MKKLITLVLAVLMLASLTLSVSAATTGADLSSVLSYLYGSSRVYTADDLAAYYNAYGRGYYDGLITRWIDDCPEEKCNGIATFIVDGGKIKWACPTCGKSGTITAPQPEKPDKTPVVTTVVCPTCKKSDHLEYITTAVVDGELKDVYFCTKCLEVIYVKASGSYPYPYDYDYNRDYYGYYDYYFENTIKCHHNENGKFCQKDAKIQLPLTVKGDKVVATYKCPDGHVTEHSVSKDEYEYRFTVSVVAATGGDSAVRGGTSAKYGETKTVVFYPKTGYALTSVLVNGTSVAFKNNEVSFNVYGPVTVRPTFTKVVDLRTYNITASATGNGSITALKNSAYLSSSAKVEAKRTDTVAFNFIPSGKNYRVSDVKVDGRSVGAVSTYSFKDITADHKVEVTFAWKAPYDDVIERYLPAVEFVTESGVMGAYSGNSFSGTVGITADDLICALAELTDTAQVLSDNTARRAWITANGIAKGVDLAKTCDVQTACAIVVDYLKVIEQKNAVTFLKLDKTASLKDATVALNLATAKTFDANRSLNRYDLAAICRLIARLEYRG